MRQLSSEIFCEADGILRKTIQNFFDSIHFYIQRRSLFNGFFKLCMSVSESSDSILKVLYDLSVSYLLLYNKTVMVISGSLEKRQRCGKIMINTSEIERILLRVFLYPLDFRFQGLQVHSPNQIFKIWNFDVVSQLELHTVH